MKTNLFVFSVTAGAALLLAAGCGKQEPSAGPTAPNSASSTPTAAPAVPNPPASSTASAAAPETAPTPALANPATTAQTPAQNSAVVQPVAAPSTDSAKPATQVSFQSWQSKLAQSASNSLQGTAAAATNQGLAALGMTNTIGSTVTNQVEALLEKAKSLTANQKYQEALGTVTELYNNKLTPEQKVKADELKAQIQTALSQKATSALGDMFGGKK